MKAIKAIYTGREFEPQEPIPVNGKYEVAITFLEEISETAAERETRIAQKVKAWEEICEMIAECDEPPLLLENFQNSCELAKLEELP
ncbi:MAG: hypothetical protein FWG65_00930 [Turicibacter sp.]|nr:hypothetical protein [Turicibacter sp.]